MEGAWRPSDLAVPGELKRRHESIVGVGPMRGEQVRETCNMCRGYIIVNKSGALRKHDRSRFNGLGNRVPLPCEGSGEHWTQVKTDLERRFPAVVSTS